MIYKNVKLVAVILLIFFILSSVSISIQAITNKAYSPTPQNAQVTVNIASQVAQSTLTYYGKQNQYDLQQPHFIYDYLDQKIFSYLFPLTPEGYIVVSASYDIKPVLAYSFSGEIPEDNDISHPFFSLLRNDIQTRLNHKQHHPSQTNTYTTSLWNQKIKESIRPQTNNDVEYWPPEGATETGGWIETTWHQNKPFKNFCPMDHTTDKRSIAGCPSIAMAQILNYHQTTKNIQFTDADDYRHSYLESYMIDDDHEGYDFPSFPELNTHLNHLNDQYENHMDITDDDKAALTFACGIAAEQIYSSQGSGTLGVDQAYQAYMRFNCTTAQLLEDDIAKTYEEIIEDIKEAQPVHLAVVNPSWTTGHNLIIDGYNTDDYFHLNFGFGGSYDGWYQLPQDLPFELTVLEGVIVDIMENVTASDLVTTGSINLKNMKPGAVINGSFHVQNNGEPGSRLDWHIETIPDWGTWTITPSNQTGLTPEEGLQTINVTVNIPDRKKHTFTGGITLVNNDHPGDKSSIPIYISTPKNDASKACLDFNDIHHFIFQWFYQYFFQLIFS
ncbi:MAG: C10 family peptidase [Thermoplasmatota archaeon]